MQTLYNDLMNLCQPEDSPFYFVDHSLDGVAYRVFTYRLGQYSDFVKPSARECRGHMFEIDASGNYIRMAALPQEKFFNYQENPFTMGLDFSNGVELIMDKVDGSLISSFLHKGQVKLKSKTSLSSEQAMAAEVYLAGNKALHRFLSVMAENGYTVNMEFTSPQYRIVIPHQVENLTVLNLRHNGNGERMPHAVIAAMMDEYGCKQHLVRNFADKIDDPKVFVESVAAMTETIEGFVVKLKNGETFKVKTNSYVALHKLKDSIGSPRALFEVVVNEAHDDAKAAFANDHYVVSQIEAMEKVVAKIYADLKVHVVGFYNANKELDRKSFAIKGQTDLPKLYFGLAMTLYLGKEINYKEFLIKHYKDFGIKDESKPVDSEN